MTATTKSTLENSEQHVELGNSRRNRDVSDLTKIQAWFSEHNPFEGGAELRSLATGICSDGTINCDETEEVGRNIQTKLDNVYFHDAKVKRSAKVKNIESLYNSVKISDKKSVLIKPTALFLRLIAIAQRESNIEHFFSCELTSFPMSLFKDGLMRKPNKAILRNALLTSKVNVEPNALHVIDGGALLHKVRWTTNLTFGELCNLYVNHIRTSHGVSNIVFDGYNDKPSTKDHEHTRRSMNKRGCAEVKFDVSTKVTIKQDVFLSSNTNKSRFINMLSNYLIGASNKVIKCDEDADTEIVKCALNVAETGRRVNVVADDTDVALLLLYHWNENMADITFTFERSKATFSIKSSLSKQSDVIKPYLLVLHAWTGCDTTSATHSKGKTSLLKKLEASPHLRNLMDVLSDTNADQTKVSVAGIALFVKLYSRNDTLSKLRYILGPVK